MRIARLMLLALIAATVLAAMVANASGRNLSISNQQITVVWNAIEFSGGGASLRCSVTLEGSFHSSTIAKVVGSLVGYVTRATFRRPCTGGTVWAYNGTERNEVLGNTTFPNSLPWHLSYEGFSGTLPNITSARVLLSGARYQARATVFGVTLLCDYTSGAANGGNATGTAIREAGGALTGLDVSGTVRSSSGGFCPTGTFTGRGSIALTVGGANITVTLI